MGNEHELAVPLITAPDSAHREAAAASPRTQRWAFAGISLFVAAMWMLLRPYRSIEHDSVIYTLFALARIYPQSLGHDFFVRFGAQDHYTIFSPLYASAIRILGVDHAAALLTFITQIAFCACAWQLARRFMSARQALLAIGLLVVLPSYYGSERIFSYIEPFLTPRQPAEAFALAGLAVALTGRQWMAAALMLASALLHPIIAAAGIALWLLLTLGIPRPRLALGVAIGGLGLFILLSATVAAGPFAHFDSAWLSLLQSRLKYLFPTLWPWSDWSSALVPLLTLTVGSLCCAERSARVFSGATVVTVIFGLIFAITGGDWLHVVIVAQGQMWRWLWLSGLASVLLMPLIFMECWTRGSLGRAAVVLLLAAWLPLPDGVSWLPALAACLCAVASRSCHPSPGQARLVLIGAWCVLALCAGMYVNDALEIASNLDFSRRIGSHYGARIGELRVLGFDGVLPATLLLLVWVGVRNATRRSAILMAVLGATACLVMLPYSVIAWTQVRYPEARIAAFAPWREVIPPSAEVLWPISPGDDWLELERPSYWSLLQMAGMVFSRQDAMIGARREDAVAVAARSLSVFAAPPHLGRTSARGPDAIDPRATLCAVPDLQFFASWIDLGPTPYPPIVRKVGARNKPMYLYRCTHTGH